MTGRKVVKSSFDGKPGRDASAAGVDGYRRLMLAVVLAGFRDMVTPESGDEWLHDDFSRFVEQLDALAWLTDPNGATLWLDGAGLEVTRSSVIKALSGQDGGLWRMAARRWQGE